MEKFVAAHGISLDSRLPTAVAASAALRSSSPLSSSPLPAASLQHQDQQDTHSPSESSTGPDSRALLVRAFALHRYDSSEALFEATYLQERSDSDVDYASCSSGRAVDHGRLHGRQERSVAEAQDNLETQDDLEAQHDIEAQDGLEAHDDLQEQDDLDAMAQDDASSDALKQAQVA